MNLENINNTIGNGSLIKTYTDSQYYPSRKFLLIQNRKFFMKRLLSIFIVLVMLFSLAACSEDDIFNALDSSKYNSESISYSGNESSFYTDINQPDWQNTQIIDTSTVDDSENTAESTNSYSSKDLINYNESYYDVENIVLYIYTYGKLPQNFITKSDARKLGWEGGSVETYLSGAAIGGDKFSNREGLLPKSSARIYTECDIDTNGAESRGAKRLVFSNDGLYFYTENHYESFVELYIDDNYEVLIK